MFSHDVVWNDMNDAVETNVLVQQWALGFHFWVHGLPPHGRGKIKVKRTSYLA
jgi:hypothetical protein